MVLLKQCTKDLLGAKGIIVEDFAKDQISIWYTRIIIEGARCGGSCM
jgi:hypothetical protein